MFTKIEFAVQMTCEGCAKAVQNSLKDVSGINNVDVNLENNSVVVDTTLTTDEVFKHLQSSGKKVVVKGLAGNLAAVAILDVNQKIQGVVRFAQVNSSTCIIDGTIDGLEPGEHGLYIHECGDISQGCDSVGECFALSNYSIRKNNRVYGDLGVISAEADGRANFRIEDEALKLSDVIGRSLVVTEHYKGEMGNGNKRLTCGIIARSSGLFQNPKTICACDGISIWDERNMPKSPL